MLPDIITGTWFDFLTVSGTGPSFVIQSLVLQRKKLNLGLGAFAFILSDLRTVDRVGQKK